jgi:hypothetical protein
MLLRQLDKSVKFRSMQRGQIVRKWLLFTIFLLLVSACTTRPKVGVDVDADDHSSSSRVLFSQPF